MRILLLFLSISLSAITSKCVAQQRATSPTSEVVLTSEIEWKPLNPARGNKGPQAGTLWGDQTKSGSSGFLVKFVDGFSSPPHIHNITYRGIVIGGGLHNDDPDAKPMWMTAGSYWMQPAGEVHITAARGMSVAYVEIQGGPYLVLPAEESFDKGERPVNVDVSNLIWLDASDTNWIRQPESRSSEGGPEIAFLWGKPNQGQLNGTLVRLPSGFKGAFESESATFRSVVIQGPIQHQRKGEPDLKILESGSYFGSTGISTHRISCGAGKDCLIYVRTKGRFDVVPQP